MKRAFRNIVKIVPHPDCGMGNGGAVIRSRVVWLSCGHSRTIGNWQYEAGRWHSRRTANCRTCAGAKP